MDTRNGNVVTPEELASIVTTERKFYKEIKTDLTERQKYKKKIRKYDLCPCGSGRKFKFCCFDNS